MKKQFKFFAIWLAKSITVLFALLTVALLIISLVRPEWIKTAIDWIGNLIETLGNWNYLIAFLSACIESLPIIGTAVPGMNIMILVGGFWGKSHLLLTLIFAIVGAMLGNALGYWIGKTIGKEIIEKYGEYIGLGKTEEKILQKQIKKNGFWYIVLGKFHNFTRAFVPFIAGSSGMNPKSFWLYNMIGSIVWAAAMICIGIFFVEHYETILKYISQVILVLMLGFLAYMYFFKREVLQKYFHDKNKEIEEKIAQKTANR